MSHLSMLLLAVASTLSAGGAPVHTEEADYRVQGETMKGYLAYDEKVKGKRPGVLVVHEWWGINEHARQRARMLAALGYTALALDMYGEGRGADNPTDAGKLAGSVMQNPETAQTRFKAALDRLRQDPHTDPKRIAAIGFCFGGGVALEMARAGIDMQAVVSFHGSLGTQHPAKPGAIKGKLLVLHGAADKLVPDDQVAAFKDEMARAGVDYTFVAYPGAQHAFTNPEADANAKRYGLPLGYDAAADKASWEEMQRFFKKVFKQ